SWLNGRGDAEARVQVLHAPEAATSQSPPSSPSSLPASSAANLRLAEGVLHVVSSFGGQTPPKLTAELKQISFSEVEHGIEAEGVSGGVAITSFKPLATPPGQMLTA